MLSFTLLFEIFLSRRPVTVIVVEEVVEGVFLKMDEKPFPLLWGPVDALQIKIRRILIAICSIGHSENSFKRNPYLSKTPKVLANALLG